MIQMCVYNSILAGRLGDCWLAPGRLLAGCTGRLLAGPWKAGWSLGRLDGPWKATTACCTRRLLAGVCWFAEFADFRWSPSLGESLDTEWIRFVAKVNLVAIQTLNGPPRAFLALFDPVSSQ